MINKHINKIGSNNIKKEDIDEKRGEEKYYEIIRERLIRRFREKHRDPYLEITANKGFSDAIKQKIPPDKEIIFSFLSTRKTRPDIIGYVKKDYDLKSVNMKDVERGITPVDFIIAEVKEKVKLQDIYQTKLYKDLFNARYAFLISLTPIPTELTRLCDDIYNILHSARNRCNGFFVLTWFLTPETADNPGDFRDEDYDFIGWYGYKKHGKDPFKNEIYWK